MQSHDWEYSSRPQPPTDPDERLGHYIAMAGTGVCLILLIIAAIVAS